MIKILSVLTVLLSVSALPSAKHGKPIAKPFITTASHYSDALQGKLTASGERFDNSAFTAAHRTAPFNTRLLVMNVKNGKTVKVRVNDRGPFVFGRGLDLSKAAFDKIADKGQGLIRVRVEVVK